MCVTSHIKLKLLQFVNVPCSLHRNEQHRKHSKNCKRIYFNGSREVKCDAYFRSSCGRQQTHYLPQDFFVLANNVLKRGGLPATKNILTSFCFRFFFKLKPLDAENLNFYFFLIQFFFSISLGTAYKQIELSPSVLKRLCKKYFSCHRMSSKAKNQKRQSMCEICCTPRWGTRFRA